jgi:hypothetical protein
MLGGQARRCHTSRVLATRTFLFADLRDYAGFVEKYGDAELGERAAAMARQAGARETEIRATNTGGSAMGTIRKQTAEAIAVLRHGYAMAEEHGYTMEAGRALNNIAAALGASDAGFSEMQQIHREALAHSKKHGHRDDALLSREVLYAFLDGDWDTALTVGAESRTEGIWSAGRDQNVATMLVAREGPLPAHLALAETATRQLLAAGDRQWVAVATVAVTTYYAAERWSDAVKAAEPARALVREHIDVGPILQAAMVGLRAAALLGDQAMTDRWIEDLISSEHGTARSEAASLFAKALRARRTGRHDEAATLLARSVAVFEKTPAPYAKLVVRQELIEVLAEAGRLDDAGEVFRALSEYWHRAKATWYLGRLEAWAHDLGVATSIG